MTFVQVWVGYAAIGTLVVCVLFLWAVRSKQFTELDRQRYIALQSAQLPESEGDGGRPSKIDRMTIPALFILCLITVVTAIWLGTRGGQ